MMKKRLIVRVLLGMTTASAGGFLFPGEVAEAKDSIDTYTLGDLVVTGTRYGEELPGGFMKESSQVGLLGEKDAMEVPFQAISLTQKTIDVLAPIPARRPRRSSSTPRPSATRAAPSTTISPCGGRRQTLTNSELTEFQGCFPRRISP